METIILDEAHRYLFIFCAVVGACWIVARAGMLVLDALLWLAELMASDGEDEPRTKTFL